jgi:hypothetical protein
MTEKTDTRVQAFSSEGARDAAKQALAMGRASLNIPYEKIGDACDVSASRVKAWCDPKNEACPPSWLPYRLRQRIPLLATYFEAQLEALARQDLRALTVDFDAQQNVMLSVTARVIGDHAERNIDGVTDLDELDRHDSLMASVIENAKRSMEASAKKRAELRNGDRTSNVHPIAAKGGVR